MSSNRTELKFIVSLKHYRELREALSPYTRPDTNVADKKTKYQVTSVYYDTADFLFYRERMAGDAIRTKFRIRYYDDNPKFIWLELKCKDGQYQRKLRYKTEVDSLDYILSRGEGNEDLDQILFEYNLRKLQSVIRISYLREPLLGVYEADTRITFDSEIRAAYTPEFTTKKLANEDYILNPFYFILEVKKTDALPTWLSHIIENFNLERIVFSKYTNSIDKCSVIERLRGDSYDY